MSNLADNLQVQDDFLNLANHVGSFIEYWGFKKIHGKVWTLIFVSSRPVDAKYLIENLNISKALVSMTLKELLQHNVIVEVKKDSPCTQKYVCNDDILGVIFEVMKNREVPMLQQVSEAHTLIESSARSTNDPGVDQKRLESLGGLVFTAQLFLKGIVSTENLGFESLLESLAAVSK